MRKCVCALKYYTFHTRIEITIGNIMYLTLTRKKTNENG